MWWRSATLALLLAASLSACGFHALYGRSGVDPYVNEELASIQVDPLRDRDGQLIHNALLEGLNPAGAPSKPRYHLQVLYTITQAQQALRADQTATRNFLYYQITYRLYEGDKVVTAGLFPKNFSYDYLQEHYGNVSSQSDTEHRAAIEISHEVCNRLAIYFTKAAELRAAPPSAQK